MKSSELRKLVKEIAEESSSFKLDPQIAFKIYDILVRKFPEIKSEYATKSSFFEFLNSNLS